MPRVTIRRLFVIFLISNVVTVVTYFSCLNGNKAQLTYYISYTNGSVQRQLMYIDDPHIKVTRDLCDHLISSSSNDLLDPYFKNSFNHWKPKINDYTFLRFLTDNCTETYVEFIHSHNVSREEKDFPIAYEILIHYKEPITRQYVRFLKNIYRPQNYYCIHIDKRSPSKWTNLMRKFAMCFPNVIVTEKQIQISYGSASILNAHLECFKELSKRWKEWKYVISLHGTELPLMTNKEITSVLKAINGNNIVARGTPFDKLSNLDRKRLTYKAVDHKSGLYSILSKHKLGKIPYNLNVFKSTSAAHSAFSRQFVRFIFSNEKAIAWHKYVKDVQAPEEFFFSTINALPEAPGGFNNGTKNPPNITVPVVSARHFMNKNLSPSLCKRRKAVHDACIASSSDLKYLVDNSRKKKWMFFNKYLINYDHIVMDCIESELISRHRNEFL